MKAPPIAPKITLGYVGGADPFIAAIETVWPDPEQAPLYQARLSRHKGFTELQKLADDPRIGHCTLVCWSDEVESEELSESFDIQWCRVVSGPGTEKEAQVLVNIEELATVLRRLAEQKRLRFPKTMGALGRRAGGKVETDDHELVALGLAAWYAYQVWDRTRSVAKHPMQKEPPPWDDEIPDPENEGELSDLMANLSRRENRR